MRTLRIFRFFGSPRKSIDRLHTLHRREVNNQLAVALRGGGPGDTVASMQWTQRRGLQDTGGVLCQTAEQFLALVATVNIACCGSRDGCTDGFPTTCTMTCAAEYLPFIERCHEQLQSFTQGVSSMQPYDTFQLVCSAMDTGQLARALDEMWCTPPPPPATTVRSLAHACIIALTPVLIKFAIHIVQPWQL